MKNEYISRVRTLFLLGGLCCGFATGAFAQFFPQGQGGGRGGATAGQRVYPNNTQVGEATISIDPTTRKLIIVTDEDTNLQIKDVITSLDHPQPQVLIKVVFLEVTYTDGSDIGVEGGFVNKINSSTSNNAANVFGLSGLSSVATNVPLNALGQPIQSFQPIPPGAGLYQILNTDYQITLRAIAQSGKAEVLSRPSILARNSQPATISLGQDVPLITGTTYNIASGQINTVQYRNIGIILRVTPFITSENFVEMIVSPETSTLADQSQWVPIGNGTLAPVINSRSADTVVVVPNGQTVIIGGLMDTHKAERESKIPLLGDIPLLGAVFRHKTVANLKTELMIFLTPHIVQAPTQLAGLTADEKAKATLIPKSHETEIEKFFDSLPMRDPSTPPEPVSPKNNSKSKKKSN